MKVLIACEFSGIVRDAFIARGHDAISCDLLPSERPGPHLVCDARDLKMSRWDLCIAHPPCTYLCNSGVRWLHSDPGRWTRLRLAAYFFLVFLHSDCPRVAVENPVMHKHAVELIGRRQDFCVQPYQFGDPETKRTCFWTKNLPPLAPTNVVEPTKASVHREPPSPDRWKNRSRTFQGIADAMAEQWGG